MKEKKEEKKEDDSKIHLVDGTVIDYGSEDDEISFDEIKDKLRKNQKREGWIRGEDFIISIDKVSYIERDNGEEDEKKLKT